MKENIFVQEGVTIPEHEIEITASRSGGAGGQHVQKASTRITVRWNVRQSAALTEEQKERVISKLVSSLTAEGDLIIHHSSSRSQYQNKVEALRILVHTLRNALHIPKKRKKTKVPKGAQEKRLKQKKMASLLKASRKKNFD